MSNLFAHRLVRSFVIAGIAAAVLPGGMALSRYSGPGSSGIETTVYGVSYSVRPGADTSLIITFQSFEQKQVTLTSITDVLPGGFTYDTGTTSGAVSADPAIDGRRLTWSGPVTVPAGGLVSISFGAQVANQPGSYVTTATATPKSRKTDVSIGYATIRVVAPTSLVADPVLPGLVLRAHLAWAGGPIAGAEIDFSSGLVGFCSAITDSNGDAVCASPLSVVGAVANRGYNAYFWGDELHEPSTANGNLS
jgi:hypothetical protein